MNYPIEILPNKYYKDICCSVNSFLVIRHFNLSSDDELNELYEPNTKQIKLQYICSPSQHVADLSTSLLGVFKLEHTKIDLTKEGKSLYSIYCKSNESIKKPELRSHFNLNKSRHYWWCEIKKMHGQKVNFIYNGTSYCAECRIEHSPMKWNYWHFSFRWYIDNNVGYWHEIKDEKLKNKLAPKIGHEGRSLAKMYCETGKLEKYPIINTNCYKCNFIEQVKVFFDSILNFKFNFLINKHSI